MEATDISPDIVSEFVGAELGDLRLSRRLLRIVEAIARSPERSLPRAFRDPSQLESAYRFIENEQVGAEAVLAPHRKRTMERSSRAGAVLVLHDTTMFQFGGGGRDGIGVIDPSHVPGFYTHSSLCTGLDRQPLGVGRLYGWYRQDAVRGKLLQSVSQYASDRESLRWNEAVHEVDDLIREAGTADGVEPRIIHVMDREADCLELLADMLAHGRSFVLRAKGDRRLEPGRHTTDNKLFAAVAEQPVRLVRQVTITRGVRSKVEAIRFNKSCAGGRKREAVQTWTEVREAQLEVRATRRTIYGSNGCHAHVPVAGLELSIVHVQEANAPEGSEPVCWYLLTDQPVRTLEDIELVVDSDRRRWLIEELFRAIKTGCQFERHQFEHGDRYAKMLAIHLPMAVQMLQARWFDRFRSDAPAEEILQADQLEALRAYQHQQGKPLSANPTVTEVTRAVARIGGHLPQNGPPGWLILSRGFTSLNDITEGWRATCAWFAARDQIAGPSDTATDDEKREPTEM